MILGFVEFRPYGTIAESLHKGPGRMMRSITDQPTQQDDRMAAAVERVQEQLSQLTVFSINRANVGKFLSEGLRVLGSRSLTDEQLQIAAEYQLSLSAKERECLRRQFNHESSRVIAKSVGASVKWVQRTNAKHMAAIRMLIYPSE